jgi:hypothetical protein
MRQLYDQDGNPVYLRPPTPKLGWGEKLALGAVLIMVVVIFSTFLGIDPRPIMQQLAPGIVAPPVMPRPAMSVPQPPRTVPAPRPPVQEVQPAPVQEVAPPAMQPADVQYNATQEAIYQAAQQQETQRIIEENNAMPVEPVGVKQQPANRTGAPAHTWTIQSARA